MSFNIKKETILTTLLIAAMILVIVGCGLLIAGFIVDPLGVIHSTVLTAFGETCAFSGALFGVDYTYRFKMRLNAKLNEEYVNDKK